MSHLTRGRSALSAGLLLTGAVLSQGCLQRDVKEDSPNTSNVFVEQIANDKISEIDLLFVIDNSVSMGDKQAILQKAVPKMVGRLISPLCLDANGDATGASADPEGRCPEGQAAEFQPVNNIHIGVISSSLGGHGSNNCQRDAAGYYNDDRGRLIATVRPADAIGSSPFDNAAGFLAWNGEGDSGALEEAFSRHVEATGENGCGFEAPLEAWYRFLVDPDPLEDIIIDTEDGQRAKPQGTDAELLMQREAFLRPNGLVAIVVLTDENDCSAMDGGSYYNNASYGYLIATTETSSGTYNMPIATEICESNPNDACCFSCLQQSNPPEGCESHASVCDGAGPKLPKEDDAPNARCFQNRRRFGVDLLYPTSRYVEALSRPQIVNSRTSELVDNPLLRGAGANAGKARDPGLVFFAGIVGVPWQDVATEESLNDPIKMELLTAPELNLANVDAGGGTTIDRWEVILGQPNLPASSRQCDDADARCGVAPVPPADPFMIESIDQREAGATNPISGDAIVAASSNDPRANNINGHESDHSVAENQSIRDDLQYACIFPLEDSAVKMDCSNDDSSCDCKNEGGAESRNRPLCQPPGGGASSNTQYFGKAYPGTRILQVLKDFGANSIVGSICPKNAVETGEVSADSPDYGYNPAVQAIVDRLAEKLSGKCLPRELTVRQDGTVPCTIIETRRAGDGDPLVCLEAEGRADPPSDIRTGIEKQLASLGRCYADDDQDAPADAVRCSSFEMCQILEVTEAEARDDCLYNTAQAESLPNPGFCYIDPAKVELDDDGNVVGYPAGGEPAGGPAGTNPLVENCRATERRLLRFVGKDTPAAGTITFVACTGDAASADAPIPEAAEETAGEM